MKKDFLSLRLLSLLSGAFLFLIASGAAAQADGDACSTGDQCDSDNCVDGVCCDQTCDGLCQACTAALKGTGDDGVCGLAAAGTVCNPASCNASNFHFEPADTCDASGNCVDGGPSQDCLQNDGVCAFDLCHDTNGCEVVKATDGTECGDGMSCLDGDCVESMSASAGSGISTGGAPPGTGGDSAAGGSTGTGFGGTGTPVEGGSTDVNTGCSCSLVGETQRETTMSLLVLLGGALFARRRRQSRIV